MRDPVLLRPIESELERLKRENALLRDALRFRGYDPEEEVHHQLEEAVDRALFGED